MGIDVIDQCVSLFNYFQWLCLPTGFFIATFFSADVTELFGDNGGGRAEVFGEDGGGTFFQGIGFGWFKEDLRLLVFRILMVAGILEGNYDHFEGSLFVLKDWFGSVIANYDRLF